MSFLLDTHVFLWLLGEPDRVGGEVRELLADRANPLWVSAVSAMEVSTKIRLGRLTAPGLVETWESKVDVLAAEPLHLSPEPDTRHRRHRLLVAAGPEGPDLGLKACGHISTRSVR